MVDSTSSVLCFSVRPFLDRIELMMSAFVSVMVLLGILKMG